MKRKKIDAAKNLKNHIKYSKSNFEKNEASLKLLETLSFLGFCLKRDINTIPMGELLV